MAGVLSLFSRSYNEPMPRMCHSSWQTRSKVLVQGGRTKDYSEKTKQRLSSVVEVFDLYTEEWQQKEVTGKTPAPGVHLAASASVDDDMFTFGGRVDGSRWYNSLHLLKRGSQWIELCPQDGRVQSPMAKNGAGMVAFSDTLAVLGGYGKPHGPTQPGSSFITDARFTDGRGWTNEIHLYNLSNGAWTSPDITGERPPPCACFSLSFIDSRKAVLFGGHSEEQGKLNDVYKIDLPTMHCTKLSKSGEEPWPEERAYHAACCLNYGQQHPQLLVTGGLNTQSKALGDTWVLDVDSGRWRKVSGTLQPRWGHSVTAFCHVHGATEVTIFGGSADPWAGFEEKLSKLADTTLLQFWCFDQFEWELFSVTPSKRLRSEERVSMKKIQREQRIQMQKRLHLTEERAQQAEKGADELQRRLNEERRESERLAVQLEERERMLRQAEERAQEAEAKVEQERERVQRAEEMVQQERERVQGAEERVQQERERLQRAEERVQREREVLGQRVQQAEARADELQRRLDEVEGREQERLTVTQQAITAKQGGPSCSEETHTTIKNTK